MPAPRRTPWIAVDVDIRKDDRLVDLPNDTARYGYIAGVLAEARLQDPRGVFPSRSVIAEAIGRFDRYVPKYIDVGLLHTAPISCISCREKFGSDLKRGAIVVHNWHGKQHDPSHAERQERHRRERLNGADDDGEGDAKVTPRTVTLPSRSRHVQADGDAKVTAYSRARAVTQTQTLDTREEVPSSGVTPRAKPSSASRGSSSASQSDERPDVAALKARGWSSVSAAQVRALDEVADYERTSEYDVESGQRVVAQWILDAPSPVNDLLTWVFAHSRRVRDQRQREADARAAVHEEQKDARLHPAIGALS